MFGIAIIAGLASDQDLVTANRSALGIVEDLVLDTVPAWFLDTAIGASIVAKFIFYGLLTHHR